MMDMSGPCLWVGTISLGGALSSMFGALFTLPPTVGAEVFTMNQAGALVGP